MDPIVGPKNFKVPSYILYAYDILIFYKGKISNIKNPITIFKEYVAIFGQVVNCGKSFIYGGAMSSSRLNILADLSGLQKGYLPFIYLGVPIFKGKPKRTFLKPIADRMINKLASWKGSLLSFVGRVELVNSTILGMLTYNMTLYVWPLSLIGDIERVVMIFIWSGVTSKSKTVTVA